MRPGHFDPGKRVVGVTAYDRINGFNEARAFRPGKAFRSSGPQARMAWLQ